MFNNHLVRNFGFKSHVPGERFSIRMGRRRLDAVVVTLLVVCSVTFRDVIAISSTTSSTTTTQSTTAGSVIIPPAITLSPASVSYRPSSSVQLQCGATGTPTPTYTWYFNGVLLTTVNQSNIVQQSGGTFTIQQATSTNAGYYQCIVNNVYGTAVTNVAFLQLASLGSFPAQTTAATVTVSQGSPLSVQCKGAPTSVPTATYGWAIVTSLTSTSGTAVSLSSRVQVGPDGNLYFANTVSTDSSTNGNLYSCNLHNSVLDTTVGGSYTSLTVTTLVASSSAPSFAYSSSSPVSILEGQSFTLYCFFYGNPTPSITWTGPDGLNSSLSTGRYTLDNYNTQLTILSATSTDAGKYTCTGTNTLGSYANQLTVVEYIAPTFTNNTSTTSGPTNINATDGDTVEIDCSFESNPVAQITWYQNYKPLTPTQLPTKYSLSTDNNVLTISNVCKACADGTSDLTVIQCNVSNSNGFAFGQAYVNVLDPTSIQSISPNQTILAGGSATLACQAYSDPSTPVNITWYLSEQEVQVNTNSLTSLYYVTNAALTQQGFYTCFATNSYSNASATATLVITPPVYATAADYWYIFLILGLIILILLAIIFGYFFHKHNVGESYPVDDIEKENGNDPVKDLQDTDFHDFQRPEGTKTGMTSAMPSGALDDSFDGQSVDVGNGYNGGPAGQYNKSTMASSAATMSAADTYAITGAAPRRIQLTGAAYRPNGAQQYHYPDEASVAGGDLDAALVEGSVAGSELRQNPVPVRLNSNPAYAGSMPMLNEEMLSLERQQQLNEQRRRLAGSAPTVLDDARQLQPREFPADRYDVDDAPMNYDNPRDAWIRNGGAAGTASTPPGGYHPNVDRWIDDASTGDAGPSPYSAARRPGAPPPPPPPARSAMGYADLGRQMSYPPPSAAVDDVFPVMYDDIDDRSTSYSNNDGYDDVRLEDPRRRPVAMVRSPHNVSIARTASESSV